MMESVVGKDTNDIAEEESEGPGDQLDLGGKRARKESEFGAAGKIIKHLL